MSEGMTREWDGLVVVDKPVGVSSMDVVRRVRRAASRSRGVKRTKCGHAGTLDPLASGVMVLCLGRATKAVERLMGQTKVYETDVDLSAFTASGDAESEREAVAVEVPPTAEAVAEACAAMVGRAVEQVPPIFSAVHVDGRRAYALAREGREVELKARTVRIDAVELLDYGWPIARLRVVCGKGTYVRSIGRDLGIALGTGGYLTALRRTAVGGYRVEDAVGLKRFADGWPEGVGLLEVAGAGEG
jgi:tRNA pseudouridine55 synthase